MLHIFYFHYPITRCINLLKVATGYALSTITHRDHTMGLPVTASIEPANYCNLHCPQCPTGLGMIKKTPKTFDINRFKDIIEALSPELCYLNLYFQGEPFLCKELPQMVECATAHHIFTSISTNGHFLDKDSAFSLKKAGLGKLIVSLDGATPESYAKYRIGGDFDRVIDGIHNAVNAGLKVELQCLLLSSTENEISKIKDFGKKLGVWKTTFKTAQFYTQDPLMPTNNSYSRYKKDSLRLKNKLKNKCWRVVSGIVITTEGNVLPCCFDKDCTHSYGNLFQYTINKDALCRVIHSQKASEFKSVVFSNRKCIKICTNCTE